MVALKNIVTVLMAVTKHLTKPNYWKEGFLFGSQLKGTDVGREILEAKLETAGHTASVARKQTEMNSDDPLASSSSFSSRSIHALCHPHWGQGMHTFTSFNSI